MTEVDGLARWEDGPLAGVSPRPSAPGAIPAASGRAEDIRLWVVRSQDVVAAPEHCAFGKARKAGSVKHTNLTGGAPAHCGGELLWVDGMTLILSGASGRYPPRTVRELLDAATAFRDSGYQVWYLGLDPDTNWPRSMASDIAPEWMV